MEKTAVEWLVDELTRTKFIYSSDKQELHQLIKILEQAKEIEKKQIESAWKASEQNMRSQFSSSKYKNITFENWLNK